MTNPINPLPKRTSIAKLPNELPSNLLPEPEIIIPDNLDGALFSPEPGDADPAYPQDRFDQGNQFICQGFNQVLQKCRKHSFTNQTLIEELEDIMNQAANLGWGEIWDTMSREILHDVVGNALRIDDNASSGRLFEWERSAWKQRLVLDK